MLFQKIYLCKTMVRVAIKFVISVAESVRTSRASYPHPRTNIHRVSDPLAFSGFIS
ncbi:hypothetical protein Lalb_Chr16g0384511 [Lupinus albus]|uniref:Uncharacterized protein n=1 Tax=Lupinus albus TaxID=3870 RepID=A0A6A4P989_LUPAL|nr:hypothetical protein Lalb_Chr16g0384511 [Lupinus albus]